MHAYRAGFALVLLLLLVPLPAAAAFPVNPLSISFGGKIVAINYCANGAVLVTIKPAGPNPPGPYVWIPTTQTFRPPLIPTVATPPWFLGQKIVGTAGKIPYFCFGFGLHPPLFAGLPMLWSAVSTGPISI